jgi:hypothetical protein
MTFASVETGTSQWEIEEDEVINASFLKNFIVKSPVVRQQKNGWLT